jgi:hypothetical protein
MRGRLFFNEQLEEQLKIKEMFDEDGLRGSPIFLLRRMV